MEKFAVSRLVGSPPGYVGYEAGGQLTEAVRRKPYAVVLCAEVEKAQPPVIQLLLRSLEARPLSKEDLIKIVDLETANFAKRLTDRKITMEFTQEAKDLLIEKGYDEKYGARPLRRAVEHYLEDPLAEALLKGDIKDGEPVVV